MALSRLTGGDWDPFEKLASTFLVSEYPSLRTMASPSGDGGRDSELFNDTGEPATVIQYSVSQNWSDKIRKTAKRLKETFPSTTSIIYLTNQVIGADADTLKRTLRQNGLILDVRDRSWFLERANTDRNREFAAESLAKRYVDPLLSSKSVDSNLVTGLESDVAKTALLFLEMQVQDTDRSLGLTKASFDTLTLAALRDTDTTKRLSKTEIYTRVERFLPSHPAAQIKMKVDASLQRLSQRAIRHRKDCDEYHLLDSEISRVSDSIARIDRLRREFESELHEILNATQGITINDPAIFVKAARRVLEIYFLRKGESFATAAIKSEGHRVDEVTLRSVANEVVRNDIGVSGRAPIQLLLDTITTLLATPSESASAYLSLLLESYTLFAFLAATPDVQKATRAMFGGGEIWLDTSVILPLLAEQVMPRERRPYTEMFHQARQSGLLLYVTHGVLEEVERHINRCRAYSRSTNWHDSVPFLYSIYVVSGGSKETFRGWLENFVGDQDSIHDIADYLSQFHGIRLESASDHQSVPADLAQAVRHTWQEVHSARRLQGDPHQTMRLAAHDSEMYLHVLSSRIDQHGRAPLGYTNWWLTLDTKARGIMERIDHNLRPTISIGPVLSIDFLIRYLAFGPSRDRIDPSGSALARIYADTLIEPIPPELMSLVTELREQHEDLAENVVQRRIRDTLNHERSRMGSIDSGGPINPADLFDQAY